jgi:hypothetical protein
VTPTIPGDRAPDAEGWETGRLVATPLRVGHDALLQAVFEGASDFFRRAPGEAGPDPDAAGQELRACAASAGRTVAVLLDRGSGEPVGAIGWWLGNPAPDVALLGMLMIVSGRRGHGLAREALQGLESRLAASGTRRLRTAVGGSAFEHHGLLRALGFEEMSIRDHTELGLGGAHLALFEKPLPGPREKGGPPAGE